MTDYTKMSSYELYETLAGNVLESFEEAECEMFDELYRRAFLAEAYEREIGALMPVDCKDWHQNAIFEHPKIAATVIRNLRAWVEQLHEEIERLQTELDTKTQPGDHEQRIAALEAKVLPKGTVAEQGERIAALKAEVANLREVKP